MSSLLVSLMIALPANPAAAVNDPCNFAGSPWLEYDQVLECYETTPFDADDRANQLEVFRRFLRVTDLGTNYDAQVGWQRQLNQIERRHFAGDFEMSSAFQRFALNFENRHFFYQWPYCYGAFVFPFIPIDFGASMLRPQPHDFFVERGGFRGLLGPRQIIYVDGTLLENEYLAATGIDVTPLIGQRVVSINGQNPVAFLRRFGRERVQFDRKDGVNLNAILDFQLFSVRPSPLDTFPKRPSNVIVFEDETGRRTRIRFPWVFLPSINFGVSPFPPPSSTAQFQAECAAPNPFFPPPGATTSVTVPTEGPWSGQAESYGVKDRRLPRALRARLRRNFRRGGSFVEVPDALRNVDITEIVPDTLGARVVQYKNNVTAIQIRTNFVSDWRETVRQGAAYACAKSDKLILDVRSNAGGRGDLIEWFARYFQPGPVGPEDINLISREQATEPTIVEARELANVLQSLGFPPCVSGFEGNCYADPFTRVPFTAPDWYLQNTLAERRGRQTVEVTQLLAFADGILGPAIPNETIPCPGKFEGRDLIAVANGLNGSAGFFSIEKLRDFATIVTTGGIIGRPMPTGTARGGATAPVAFIKLNQDALAGAVGASLKNPLPRFNRFIFANVELGGLYGKNLVDLYADTDLPADVRVNVWSNTEDTDGFVYGKVLEGVRRKLGP